MDPEAVISLFDSFWFNHEILKKEKKNESLKYSYKAKQSCSSPEDPKFSSLRSILVRSHSEDMGNSSFNYGSFSPNSVLFTPTLKSIPSLDLKSHKQEQQEQQEQEQEQVAAEEVETAKADLDLDLEFEHNNILQENKNKNKKKKRGGRMSKSLSDVEFDELKGFMDLGFVFSEEDKDSRLVEIIPDLQRLGEHRESSNRPYLSEVWKDLDAKMDKKREVQKPSLVMNLNWEVPALSDEIDMKDHLKLWAHTVASIVR